RGQPRAPDLGEEARVVDRMDRELTQGAALGAGLADVARLVHADEPLRGGAKDDRRLVPPAVRIAVPERLAVQQRAVPLQQLEDRLFRLTHRQAGEMLDVRLE